MKIEIPEALKSHVPQSLWGKILSSTPVVMTVISTMLAAMANSEMNRAQYDRALAAQLQSKAGDQWNLFQAKRLKGALQRSTLDILQGSATLHPLDAQQSVANADSAEARAALTLLREGKLPKTVASAPFDPAIKAALDAVGSSRPESEIVARVAAIDDAAIARALQLANDRARDFDEATVPVNQLIDRMGSGVGPLKGAPQEDEAVRAQGRDLIAARLRYTSLRYDAEAKLNQDIAGLYELQVRKGNISAERHHNRSQSFFYGMLAAQAAVVIATFAMAARQRNLLWSIAAVAGLGAVLFAAYVYLYT